MPAVAGGVGLEHLTTELFPPDSTDLSTFLTAIRNQDPDVAFTGLFPPVNISAATQAAELDVADSLMVFSVGPSDFSDLSVFAGRTLYLVQSSVVMGRGTTIPEFEQAEAMFIDVLGELPPVAAALVNSYGMALSVAAGVEAAGVVDDGSAIAEAMHSVTVPACADAPDVSYCNVLGAGAMTPGHFLDRATSMITVEDGAKVTYHLYPSLQAADPIASVELDS